MRRRYGPPPSVIRSGAPGGGPTIPVAGTSPCGAVPCPSVITVKAVMAVDTVDTVNTVMLSC